MLWIERKKEKKKIHLWKLDPGKSRKPPRVNGRELRWSGRVRRRGCDYRPGGSSCRVLALAPALGWLSDTSSLDRPGDINTCSKCCLSALSGPKVSCARHQCRNASASAGERGAVSARGLLPEWCGEAVRVGGEAEWGGRLRRASFCYLCPPPPPSPPVLLWLATQTHPQHREKS